MKLLLILSLFLILLLLFISTFEKPIAEGKIETIKFYKNAVEIKLQNQSREVLSFTNFIPLRENETIKVFGKTSEENSSIIFADKIIKITK